MSRIRPFAWLAALLAVVGWTAPAAAQHFQPFVDPGYFEPDFQFFAPAEVSEFGCGEPPNTGMYFAYDRMYMHVSRPDGEPSLFSDHGMDSGWGNRFEIGYMTEERSGWQAILWHQGGPQVNLVNTADPLIQPGQTTEVLIWGPDTESHWSINRLTMSSIELNKVWRRKQFHNGSVLEPLIGFRHIHFKDFYQREEIVFEFGPPDPPPNPAEPILWYQSDTAQFSNACFGGQLGGRWFWTRSHWTLSCDVRFFALANFQQLKTEFTEWFIEEVPDGDTLVEFVEAPPDLIRTRAYQQSDEFVWGGEIRGEASYELTREIALRFGFVVLDLGQGIGRGNLLQYKDQDVVMAGASFGVTINR